MSSATFLNVFIKECAQKSVCSKNTNPAKLSKKWHYSCYIVTLYLPRWHWKDLRFLSHWPHVFEPCIECKAAGFPTNSSRDDHAPVFPDSWKVPKGLKKNTISVEQRKKSGKQFYRTHKLIMTLGCIARCLKIIEKGLIQHYKTCDQTVLPDRSLLNGQKTR